MAHTRPLETVEIEINLVTDDPSCSYWLRDAIKAARQRDPVDAAQDARILYELLRERMDAMLRRGTP